MPYSLSEQMLYSTVKLTTYVDGNETGSGTGFFWRIQEVDRFVILLITNKHVIAGADRFVAICHTAMPGDEGVASGSFVRLNIEIDPAGVFDHPDPAVDLCALGFSDLQAAAIARGAPIFLRSFGRHNVPTAPEWAAFDAIEDVLMIGCPNGIYDRVNNLPIARRGITATPLANRYEGRDEFLIDMACFPGSSGSPVFMNQVGHTDKASNQYRVDARRFHFLGILYAGPQLISDGEIVFMHEPRIEVAGMMHLGQVIRSTAVLDLEDMVKQRLATLSA